MSDEEIMKQFAEAMREEEIKKEAPDNVAPYRATRNLNTQIGNPTVDVQNTMDINIQNNANVSQEEVVNNISNQDNDVSSFSVDPMANNISQDITPPDNTYNEEPVSANPTITETSNVVHDESPNEEPINNTSSFNIESNPIEDNNINNDNVNIENNSQVNIDNNVIDENINNDSSYEAVNNLNTEIANPTLDIPNTMDLNIESNNIDYSSNEEYIPEESGKYYPGSNSDRVFISDTNRRKKRKTIQIGSETKTMLLIIVLLFIFIMFLPRIYDLFRLIRSYFLR